MSFPHPLFKKGDRMPNYPISRRSFLAKSSLYGCSVAASPLVTPMSLASVNSDHRLIVIILRGGLDGLDALQPYGDKTFSSFRPTLSQGPSAHPITGMFALHPELKPLLPLWKAEELGFAQAVSTPYRDKRSHFDGQDFLELGVGQGGNVGLREGWLNRLLQVLPDAHPQTAYSVGRYEMLLTRGSAEVANWAPDVRLDLTEQAKRLLELSYKDDPLFSQNLELALNLTSSTGDAPIDVSGMDPMEAMQMVTAKSQKYRGYEEIAAFAAARLREEARIASFSINGWDSHRNQRASLRGALRNLVNVILRLRQDLGLVWEKTSVVAMTEFGRTVRENGTKGTDHGTGGLSLLAGGAVKGGKVYGDWPGLGESDLYKGRDLMPTQDVRAYAAMAVRGMFGVDETTLEQFIFPGLDLSNRPKIIR